MLDEDNKLMGRDPKKNSCVCKSSEGLFMPSRQVSLVVASLILLFFILFTGAFFWGQKNAITSFTNKIEQESFGDQIYSSLCSLCDSQGDTEEEVEEHSDEASLEEGNQKIDSAQIEESASVQESKLKPVNVAFEGMQGQSSENTLQEEVEETSSAAPEYYAQLAGFGTMRAAQHFAYRLQKKEVSVIVKKRQSRSARGRFVSWYQVITEKFHDKGDLEALVKRLEYEEKINDVRIVTC